MRKSTNCWLSIAVVGPKWSGSCREVLAIGRHGRAEVWRRMRNQRDVGMVAANGMIHGIMNRVCIACADLVYGLRQTLYSYCVTCVSHCIVCCVGVSRVCACFGCRLLCCWMSLSCIHSVSHGVAFCGACIVCPLCIASCRLL